MNYNYVPGANQLKFQYENESTPSDAKHVLLWSGGCDSTVLLYELLELYGKHNVIAISYNYPWLLDSKQKAESNHREAVKAKLKLRGDKFDGFTHVNFDIKQERCSDGSYLNAIGGGLPQAIGWLFLAPLYIPSGSYVYNGYIRSDDLTIRTHEYQEIFSNISKILDKDITLRMPYLYLSKSQIIEKLFDYNLYDETWYCEMPAGDGRRCLQCVPCKTHTAALVSLTMTTNNELVKSLAQREVDRINNDKNEHNQRPESSEITLD